MIKREDNMIIVFGIMVLIFVVVVMFVILLFFFYNFYKWLYYKKKYYIDYVRVNLLLKCLRIFLFNMNMFNVLDWKLCVIYGLKEMKFFLKFLYLSVVNEDVFDVDIEILDVYGVSIGEEDCRVMIIDNFDFMSLKVKKLYGFWWKFNDKFDKYFFELVLIIC